MNPISLIEIERVTGAAGTGADARISEICTDTRRMTAGSLFIALRGENFDGNEFLDDAAAGGAAAAMIDRQPRHLPAKLPLVRVGDARTAMGLLARHVRLQMPGKVIAVAGSNGKTGVKHLIHSVLRASLRGSMSPKSFNNDIGVPLSIFAADPRADYLVLEMGTNHPGEIQVLTSIALPDIGVITNCSVEHLEGLGSVDGVRRENASLIEGVSDTGALIVNGDDPALLEATSAFGGRRVTFGFSERNELWASDVRCAAEGTYFRFEPVGADVFIPLLGQHSAVNALAAIAAARSMGMDDEAIIRQLRGASGPEMRLQLMEAGGIRILNDAYNANPASMRAAMRTLAALPANGRRVAVVGDMRELGGASEECHLEIGKFIAEGFAPDLLVCVGSEAKAIAGAAVKHGMPADRVERFATAALAAAIVPRLLDGDLVLLKASRAIGLELIAREIVSRRPPLAAAS
jgi:UDP-N-acetylmuramoyl-tripeptide--D-alanyl-D-alanine ligase